MFGKTISRVCALMTAAAFAASSAVPASADKGAPADASAISYYGKGETLHSFIYMDSAEKAAGTKASLVVNSGVTEKNEPLVPLAGSGNTVKYILLVDLSTSMPHYRGEIEGFADELMKAEKQPVSVTVEGFGERFVVIKEGITSADELRTVMMGLQYDHRATDIGAGVVGAISHQAESSREDCEAAELIVLTDGEPYIGYGGDEDAAVKKAANRARKRIKNAPELIIHTMLVGSAETDKRTLDALCEGRGYTMELTSGSRAKCAGEIAKFTGSLYTLSLPLKWNANADRMEAQLILELPGAGRKMLSLTGIRDVERPDTPDETDTPQEEQKGPFIPETEIIPKKPDDSLPDGSKILPKPDGSESEDSTDSPGDPESSEAPDKESSSESSSDAESEESSSGTAITDVESSSSEKPPAESPAVPETSLQATEQEKGTNPLIWIIPCATAAVIAAVAVIVLRSRKKGGAKTETEQPAGIFMRVEILSGECLSKKREFRLTGELTIGSSPDCDIQLGEGDASPVNTRIFFADNMIMAADMNRESNTSISGMRIHAPNRLRSGDELTVGGVRMVFRF